MNWGKWWILVVKVRLLNLCICIFKIVKLKFLFLIKKFKVFGLFFIFVGIIFYFWVCFFKINWLVGLLLIINICLLLSWGGELW